MEGVQEPTVKELRDTFEPGARRRSFAAGLALFGGMTLLCLACFVGVLVLEPLLSKLALGLILGVGISALFVIGHDACHDSLTPSHRLNQVLGRLAFLPVLHPYVSWELGHNRLHHGWTNLRGVDYVYTPFSPEEFRALPAWRRGLERVYRTVAGCALFYLVEVWWKHMIAPRAADRAKLSPGWLALDVSLVLAFLAAESWVLAVRSDTVATGLLNFTCALLLPYAVWNWLIAFVTIQHHTHPASPWFKDLDEWSFFHAQVHGTIHVQLPRTIEYIFHNIFDHTAHHVDPKIPLYHLPRSQERLEARYPADIIIVPGSVPGLHRVLRVCKLYDYERHCWLDFAGRPSANPVPLDHWRSRRHDATPTPV